VIPWRLRSPSTSRSRLRRPMIALLRRQPGRREWESERHRAPWARSCWLGPSAHPVAVLPAGDRSAVASKVRVTEAPRGWRDRDHRSGHRRGQNLVTVARMPRKTSPVHGDRNSASLGIDLVDAHLRRLCMGSRGAGPARFLSCVLHLARPRQVSSLSSRGRRSRVRPSQSLVVRDSNMGQHETK